AEDGGWQEEGSVAECPPGALPVHRFCTSSRWGPYGRGYGVRIRNDDVRHLPFNAEYPVGTADRYASDASAPTAPELLDETYTPQAARPCINYPRPVYPARGHRIHSRTPADCGLMLQMGETASDQSSFAAHCIAPGRNDIKVAD